MGYAARKGGINPRKYMGRDHYDSSISTYLEEISKIPLLKSEEEQAIGYQLSMARSPGENYDLALVHNLERKMVLHNLRFVVSIAKRYQGNGVDLSDLINAGNIGVMRAAHKFDYEKGVRFITYAAWWINQAIYREIAQTGYTVKIPDNKHQEAIRITKKEQKLASELKREPSLEEIAAALGKKPSQIAEFLARDGQPFSLDYCINNDPESGTLIDTLPDESLQDPYEKTLGRIRLNMVNSMLRELKPLEQEILSFRYGLIEGEPEPMTLEAVGEIYGLTRERIRQIEEKALNKLRESIEAGNSSFRPDN